MGDLKNPIWMHLKAALFLLIFAASFTLVIIEIPKLKVLGLLILIVWSSSRLYYYCFYVIEKYISRDFKFSGLISALVYLIRGREESRKPFKQRDLGRTEESN